MQAIVELESNLFITGAFSSNANFGTGIILTNISCTSLNNVVLPASVASIGSYTFAYCNDLTMIYFTGDAPSTDPTVFYGDQVAVYYIPGTSDWAIFAADTGLTSTLWTLPYPLVLTGAKSNFMNFRF